MGVGVRTSGLRKTYNSPPPMAAGSAGFLTTRGGGTRPPGQPRKKQKNEILALDGVRVDNANFTSLLKDHKAGDRLEVAVFRSSALTRVPVTLGSKDNRTLALAPRAAAGALEKSIYAAWLKSKWEPLKPASK